MKLKKHLRALQLLMLSFLSVAVLKGNVAEQSSGAEAKAGKPAGTVLIDDFSPKSPNKKSTTKWQFVADRTRAGRFEGKVALVEHDGRSCLHLTGSVSAKNNAGFIQARAGLASRNRNFDAGAFSGISLRLKGNGRPYALALRTADTRLRWQSYQASFPTNGKWQDIKIPFTRFRPVSLRIPLKTNALRSIAVVAAAKEFNADIFIDEIAFYGDGKMHRKLTPAEERVIIHKGTERPFTGEYDNHYENGVYTCRRCGTKLYESTSKFKSGCGWPSFDDEVPGAVRRLPDKDGIRTEITCAKCGGHLGHVFAGEGYTPKNIRHCVNSISLDFVAAEQLKTERAIFASGCFWGTEYHLQRAPGVISTTVGYTGGRTANPTYKQVCTDRTGHAEAVEVIFDPSKTSYEKLARLFFETHDFTQLNRQGPDIGKQYRSAVFYLDEEQKQTAEELIKTLKQKGFAAKTEVTAAKKFWPAELHHQDYYKKTGKTPYCHVYRKIF